MINFIFFAMITLGDVAVKHFVWDRRYLTLDAEQRRGLARARTMWEQELTEEDEWPHVDHISLARRGRPRRRAFGAWLMAHRFALELDCSPWDGLLQAVRIAAGKVAYCEWVLSQAHDDLQLEGRRPRELTEDRTDEVVDRHGNVLERKIRVGTGVFVHPDTGEPLGSGELKDLSFWVHKSEYWVERLARYSKAAIDAGVAERLVQNVELEATAIARALNAALACLDSADLDSDTRDSLDAQMRAQVRAELLLMSDGERDGQKVRVIEGSAS